MRPATRSDPRRTRRGAAWVGLLLALPAVIGNTPRSEPGNVGLSILDASQVPLLEHQTPTPLDDDHPTDNPPQLMALPGRRRVLEAFRDFGDLPEVAVRVVAANPTE